MRTFSTAETSRSSTSSGPTTLSDVSGRLTPVLGATAMPIGVAGFVLLHGTAFWLLVSVVAALFTTGVVESVRGLGRLGAAAPTVLGVVYTALIAVALPAEGLLQGAGLIVMTIFSGLITIRPYAEIGIVGNAAAFAVGRLAFGAETGQELQVVATAVCGLTVGLAMLGIRVTTERRVNHYSAELQRLAQIDPLTGLANRRRMQEVLTQTWQSTAEDPISVIMIDIDLFKQYNDHFGHLGGDDCLQAIAVTVTQNVRSSDTVARYGGEEIAILLPDTDLTAASRTAEQVRAAVAALHVPHPASPTGCLTVSVGVATTVPQHGGQPDDLLERADQCLYSAKHGGRNQVSVAA